MTDLAVETAEIPYLGGTPYAGFAVRAHAALIEEGLSEPHEVMVYNDQSAIVARLATGEPIGIVTFTKVDATNSFFIRIGFVVPDFRRRGVFRLMQDELFITAERRGVTRIEFASMIGNTVMNRVATSVGYHVRAQVYRMDLPTDG